MDSRSSESDKQLQIKRRRQTLLSVAVGLAFFSVLYGFSRLCDFTVCPIKSILGIPCFGCGLTHGFLAILRLDIHSAIEYNIMSVPIFVGIAAYSLLAVIDVVFRKDFVYLIEKQLGKRYMFIFYALLLIISTVYNSNS